MDSRLFKEVSYDLGKLINSIELGQLGLPDIQRPFKWKNAKVRELFDSMYRGYPVGYFLFWQNELNSSSRTLGTDTKQKHPNLLIVDGQQRLTSLYAVIKGIPVVRGLDKKEKIEIAFNPLTEKFDVADAAIRKDKTYISNISRLWDPNSGIFDLTNSYITELKGVNEISPEQEKKIQQTIQRLYSLLHYNFTVLELTPENNEDQVAEIFVRINSKGEKLDQSDFILTLMSVFWDAGRTEIEDFCKDARTPGKKEASPFNFIFRPDPSHLIRICVGLGFRRARLHYVYSILRGKNLETEEFDEQRRDEQFEILKASQKLALDLNYWHDFLNAIAMAGFQSEEIISSKANVLFAYILYVIGRTEYKVEEHYLRTAIAKWFYMSSLTGRYTGSPETAMENDLSRFKSITSAENFLKELERIAQERLTDDFWTITLPGDLATSSSRSPSLFAYYAALVLLNAKALYSNQRVAELLNPAIVSKRSSHERHHLFPVNWLKKQGITDKKEVNQIANLAIVDWNDNMLISDEEPSKYVTKIEKRFTKLELDEMNFWHGLPDDWTNMSYQDFLLARRERIAKVIRAGYESLGVSKEIEQKIDVKDVIASGESDQTEFKSTLRRNPHTNLDDPRLELACLKSIAGFLNAKGGKLIIGVGDDGEPVGLDSDNFENTDKMYQHLVHLLNHRIGVHLGLYIQARFEDYKDQKVFVVECFPAKQPAYVKDGNMERFYVRTGNVTMELSGREMEDYIRLRFRS